MIRFASPQFLVLIALAWWIWRTGGHERLRHRQRWLRCAGALCLVMALSGLQIRYGDGGLTVLFALDASGSTVPNRAQTLSTLRNLSAAMQATDRAGLIVFAENAAIERPLTAEWAVPQSIAASVGLTTNIAAGLRHARAIASGAPARVVLLSDGNETDGDALIEAAELASASVPVDVVIPPDSAAPAIAAMRVDAPPAVRVGEPFAVTVTVRGASGRRGAISLTSSDGETVTLPITVGSDGFATASVTRRADAAGTLVFEAAIRAAESEMFDADARRVGVVVSAASEPRILYVGRDLRAFRTVQSGNTEWDAVSAVALPRTVAALTAYDAVVLDDTAGGDLDTSQSAALRTHVERNGAGLLFLGTPDNLDPAVLSATVLGDMLPIDVQRRGGQRAPEVALVVAFDKSGSMDDRVDGVPKIEFARSAVRRVFNAVPATDAVGVIAFDATAHEVAPFRVGHDASGVAGLLQSVTPSGPTAIAPAVAMAAEWLQRAPSAVGRKHLLLVSDGRTSAADLARTRTLVANGGFQLSVVALGDDADRAVLQTLAHESGGRAYFPNDIRDLPGLVARESARVVGGRFYEHAFLPVAHAHPIVSGITAQRLPELGGYVVGLTKPGAEAPLRSPVDDPVLAGWRRGLGRVAAYTADLHGAWSSRFRGSREAQVLFTQTVQWVSRRVRDGALYASFEERDDGIRLIVEAATPEGRTINDLVARATVRLPNGDEATLDLAAARPGRYEALIPAVEAGPYVFTIDATDAERGEYRMVRGFYWTADREYRAGPANVPLLTEIATITGGRVLSASDSAFAVPRVASYIDLAPWLVLTALLLFLCEVLGPSAMQTLWPSRQGAGNSVVNRAGA